MLQYIIQKKGVTDVDHYTPKFIAEKYNGLVPKQIIDMKGLMGIPLTIFLALLVSAKRRLLNYLINLSQ